MAIPGLFLYKMAPLSTQRPFRKTTHLNIVDYIYSVLKTAVPLQQGRVMVAHASRPRKRQGQVSNFAHITVSVSHHGHDETTRYAFCVPQRGWTSSRRARYDRYCALTDMRLLVMSFYTVNPFFFLCDKTTVPKAAIFVAAERPRGHIFREGLFSMDDTASEYLMSWALLNSN